MRKNIVLLFAILLANAYSFGKTIVITNATQNNRMSEMLEIKVSDLKVNFSTKSYVLRNSQDEEVPYQLLYNAKGKVQTLIFQADVKANSTSNYTLTEGEPAKVKPKTSARFVPERKDDFAWENDKAAYRMYGPALANENPSNGVDLWLKRTDELVVDKFYRNELKNGISYHVDNGQGLDCYKVGHTLGCGGIAPYLSDSLYIGNHFDAYKLLVSGPLRSIFTLTYNNVKIGNAIYTQEITITCDAGSLLNKAVVTYKGKKQPMKLAAGIFLHDKKGSIKESSQNGIIGYAENAVSDAGVPSGRNYVGVYMPSTDAKTCKDNMNLLITADYKPGNTFTYYFGGGWSKWGFGTDDEWFNALNRFSEAKRNPLDVKIK